MLSVRLKKVLSDYGTRWGRSALTLAGLTLGLFGVGAVLTTFAILANDLNENFARTNPPHIVAETSDLPGEVAGVFQNIPGVAEAEERRRLSARIEIAPERWMPIILFVVEDF